jgi:hypothetical protein
MFVLLVLAPSALRALAIRQRYRSAGLSFWQAFWNAVLSGLTLGMLPLLLMAGSVRYSMLLGSLEVHQRSFWIPAGMIAVSLGLLAVNSVWAIRNPDAMDAIPAGSTLPGTQVWRNSHAILPDLVLLDTPFAILIPRQGFTSKEAPGTPSRSNPAFPGFRECGLSCLDCFR